MPAARSAPVSKTHIYKTSTGHLFVPTEAMWNVHEASKPTAVLARALLSRTLWNTWRRKYEAEWLWLSGWLYSSRSLLPAEANGFQPPTAMGDFRKEASLEKILSNALMPEDGKRPGPRRRQREESPHVTDALLSMWRRKYKTHDWFDRWLLRGEDPPVDVVVATLDEVRRCRRAWDVASICANLEAKTRAKQSKGKRGKKRTDTTLASWLNRGLIPSIEWLEWLFGWPEPNGVFVVDGGLQRLRSQLGREAILEEAGVNENAAWAWEQDEKTRSFVTTILAGKNPTAVAGWEKLHPITKTTMLKVAESATLERCSERAGISVAVYHNAQRTAELRQAKKLFNEYLKMEGAFERSKGKVRAGLVADNFFIPSPDMLRFRAVAQKLGGEQRVWSLRDRPGFREYFLDRVVPKAHRGSRFKFAAAEATLATSARGKGSEQAVPFSTRASGDQANKGSGRRRSEETAEVYRFCYETLGAAKRRTIMRRAGELFGTRAPKLVQHVTLFAKRHATANKLAWPKNH